MCIRDSSWDAKSRGMKSWAEVDSAPESRATSEVDGGEEGDEFVSADEGQEDDATNTHAGERDDEIFHVDVVGDAPPDDEME
eukprot:743035-Alexandrium_andersonii.AAC.1